jgi:hypothetical protein
MSGRGTGGKGLGKGGLKRQRKVLRDNIRGFTNPAIRRLARKRLEEQTGMQFGSWPRVSSPSRRQETRSKRMGGGPTVSTEQDSPPSEFFEHRRPPKRYPNGDCATA